MYKSYGHSDISIGAMYNFKINGVCNCNFFYICVRSYFFIVKSWSTALF